jgi:16S rRNA (cytidine1402-2'-O)-methyltransferase
MLGANPTSLGLEMEAHDDELPAYTPIAGGSRLIVAAVPIGQPEDASARLRAALRDTPVIAAEDTRRVRRLATALGIRLTARIVSNYDEVEGRRAPVLVTDAGLPGVSDPGYRLVAAAVAAGVPVTVLPGPSAVTTALIVSGLPCDRFVFEGFLPRKGGERSRRLTELAAERRTLVLFESPRRLAATLTELAAAFGPDRRAAVCRELTKTHEEVLRGPLGELAEALQEGTLGEITLVIAGAPATAAISMADAVALVTARVADGDQRRAAIAAVAAEFGLPRRDLYNEVVRGPKAAG